MCGTGDHLQLILRRASTSLPAVVGPISSNAELTCNVMRGDTRHHSAAAPDRLSGGRASRAPRYVSAPADV